MTLSQFTRTRLLIQHPDTSAYDAARAMRDNHVGAVIVHDGEQVVGIVTDRDLALQVIGGELDAIETPLNDIMSSPAVVVSVSETEAEAAALMLEYHVRRLPVLDGAALVGLVTLDDLILEQAVDRSTLAAIVRAQLADPTRLKREGETHPTRPQLDAEVRRERAGSRHAARANLTYSDLIARTLASTGLDSRERAEAALDEVLSGIIRRISPDEARQLLAQLPSLLSARLDPLPRGPDRSVTPASIRQAVARRLQVPPETASAIVLGVCEAFGATVSAGELDDVRSQLPAEMRAILATVATE